MRRIAEGGRPGSDVHLSGIMVLGDPLKLERCRQEVAALPGVEVHQVDPATGRMIAVLESPTLRGQQEGLRRIQELPSVRLAALVEHRVDGPEAEDAGR